MTFFTRLDDLFSEIDLRYCEICKANVLNEPQFSDAPAHRFHDNLIAFADNAEFMAHIKVLQNAQGLIPQINMIYMDPPFYSKNKYRARIKNEESVKLVDVYDDRWDSLSDYLSELGVRLKLAYDLLEDNGTIFVHLDWHSVHYVKIIMDRIFGYDAFVNEIIWQYKSGGGSNRRFARKHDTILFYAKGRSYKFNPQSEKSYNRNLKPYRFKGVEEYRDEHGWYTKVNMRDTWFINMVGRSAAERTGFYTQKPEELLKRIIACATDEGDLIADFYMGSGTSLKVAHDMKRKFIGCDVSANSFEISQKRLRAAGADFSVVKI